MAKHVDPAFAAGALRVRDHNSATGRESPNDLVRLHQLPLEQERHKAPFLFTVEKPKEITDADRKDALIARGVSEAVACKLSKTPGLLEIALDHENLHASADEALRRRIENNYRMVSLDSAPLPTTADGPARMYAGSREAKLLDNREGGTRMRGALDIDATLAHSNRAVTIKDGLTGEQFAYGPAQGIVIHETGERCAVADESLLKIKPGTTGTGKTAAAKTAAEAMDVAVIDAGVCTLGGMDIDKFVPKVADPSPHLITNIANTLSIRTLERLKQVCKIVGTDAFPRHVLHALKAAVGREEPRNLNLRALETVIKAPDLGDLGIRLRDGILRRLSDITDRDHPTTEEYMDFLARGAAADRSLAVITNGESETTEVVYNKLLRLEEPGTEG
jgi:hypothetical protein